MVVGYEHKRCTYKKLCLNYMKKKIIILFFCLTSLSLYSQIDSTENNLEEIIFGGPEKMPEFLGGYEALYKYITTNAVYPRKALEDSISGRVYVTFFINQKGEISNPRILRGLHHDIDSICLRLVKNMPPWSPARNRGQAIEYNYILPISFNAFFHQSSNFPKPTAYWKRKGRKQFFKKCIHEFGKTQGECSCWHKFIIWNFNKYKLKDLDLSEIFKRQKCK